jgi:uncharacterized membrane protein
MEETALTQEAIDHGAASANGQKSGLLAKAASHPVLTGSALLVGAGLAYAAAKAIKVATEDTEVAREVHVETSIAIDRSPAELYLFWRQFMNLPLFMRNLESVSDLGSGRTHWVARGPDGSLIEWDAEIYNEKANELIAWRSLENAEIVNAGSVRFQAAPQGHGTYVRIALNYNPPAGKLGATIAQLLGADPAQLIKEDLRRLKQMIEAGEIATIDGQSSGRAAEARSLPMDQVAETANDSIREGDQNESSLLEREV